MSVRPRSLTVLALLALLPVALFIVGRSEFIVGLSLVSVVLIAASLYYMFGPSEASAADATG